MAAVAFDTLKAARHLIEARMPPRQAEAQAELMAEAFVYNVDSLVTKDYLDARLAEQDAKIEARFVEQSLLINRRFGDGDLRFAQIEGKFRLVYWMLTVVLLSTTIPAIRLWMAG
jgi:hypothetical protein